ncbi:DUF3369 domain-containing protein [Rheinheimera marina]|uniref:DUF3369 domain-containing protein n=1 Tax=Rheinheimera marina TaxID=1774958 RepID=A0ABV9JP16_9GAMM
MNNLFRPASSASPTTVAVKAPWRVLVVDDDEFIHQVTELVLSSFRFEQRPLELVRAYSAAEAIAILENDRDFAVALVDVVMETDDAGLQLVKHIREQMAILTMRIILRTGQPGQAPEFEVIEKYEINDYKDKTELTAAKLRTVVIAALRGYRDLLTIESHRRGLMRVIQNTSRVLASSSLHEFATCVLQQVVEVIDLNATGFYCVTQATGRGDFQINHCLAATADWVRLDPSSKLEILPQDVRDSIQKSLQLKASVQTAAGYVAYHISDAGYENVLYLQLARPLTEVEQSLLSMYCSNVALTYQMLLAKEDIIESQHEMAYMLGEAVEQRSKETGMHVRRVALYTEKLARLSGLASRQDPTAFNGAGW